MLVDFGIIPPNVLASLTHVFKRYLTVRVDFTEFCALRATYLTSNMFDAREKVALGIKLSKIHPHTVRYRLS